MPDDAQESIESAVATVDHWLRAARAHETARSRRTMRRLRGMVHDPGALAFVMDFIDRVARPDDDRAGARQLHAVVVGRALPPFLGRLDRLMLRAGARIGPALPGIVMPLARRRMRAIVGHLVAPAEHAALAGHLGRRRDDGWASNVNLLGEAVLGDGEADRRQQSLLDLLDAPAIDYVSVKLSSVVAQLNPWAFDDSLDRVSARLAELVDHAAQVDPPTFVNVDMEEYHDLELTIEAFERVLGAPDRHAIAAGIVLQTYLPDALPTLQRLSRWAATRAAAGGAPIKVRLVKGANLAMEQVEAALHGWPQAPYPTKAETDANYVRCLDWVLRPEHLRGLRIGVASHNLFHVAWARHVACDRGVDDRVQIEMLQGMAEAQAAAVAEDLGDGIPPLLYTPAVDDRDFDVAVGYLFRRLDENAAPANFLRALFDLDPASPAFAEQAERFRLSVVDRDHPPIGPTRIQDRNVRPEAAFDPGAAFRNDPETDPSLPANRAWLGALARTPVPRAPIASISDPASVDGAARRARLAQTGWAALPARERCRTLHRVADELAARRRAFLRVMADETGKTLGEADVEICEAIDFARYYAERVIGLDRPGLHFQPFGLVTVTPPWNFPVAIPSGGVLAAIAAGNAVLFKPAPEAIRCGALIHEAVLAADVPAGLVAFLPAGDDAVGRRIVETADAVVLTGSSETATLFRSWDPGMRLFAETSGKNALVITPHADIDLAVADLVRSAFGHAGQKCSAASLAILVGSTAQADRFHRQLVDAVTSLRIGPALHPGTVMGPLIGPANPRLARALRELDDGERWLAEPRLLDEATHLWSPGVRVGVKPGSWFHRTECFGPVLGLMSAPTLDDAISIQNSSPYGLTGGLHSLDPAEIERWTDRVEVGNAYVNRHITGAVVQRQPFGGWKRSSVGPGAKAGGPNYVAQFGTWTATDTADDDYSQAWRTHFAVEHDPTDLFCEANVLRYQPLARIVIRHGPATDPRALALARRAAEVAGVEVLDSDATHEPDHELADRLPHLGVSRIRALDVAVDDLLRTAAADAGVHVAAEPVVPVGRVELLHLVREQAVSTTLHRFGNLPPNHRPASV